MKQLIKLNELKIYQIKFNLIKLNKLNKGDNK